MRSRSFAFRPVSGAKKNNPSSPRFSIDRLIGPPRTSFGPPLLTQDTVTTMPETLQHASSCDLPARQATTTHQQHARTSSLSPGR
jgi:hypothetical protein